MIKNNQPDRSEKPIAIFTDAATSSAVGIAIGAYVQIEQQDIVEYTKATPSELMAKVADIIIFTQYTSKKSTWSEIKNVIDALYVIEKKSAPDRQVEIYTDCQSLLDLLARRKEKLEGSHFMTRAGKPHQNADLYKELFSIAEKFQIKIIKIKGHEKNATKITIQQKIFSIVDKLSRKELRQYLLFQNKLS